ncbi:uncharacterized protein THITE_2109690 [Thermothielavioides terrestris NRRL 8126]|uniref:Uncharacterized protein n=1 Tax=Thermothielavioides terrestris (strain ATCC 38088 / NRRL 8126) TaxID=578455 RepID=G2QXJ3_THETT|nr:uncharacterized protein THITE_2109690 [Thermothielavioides terrestris NRRL 8126]AEO64018.1 hypothetical protein THITE_2109690 [Thermothielavioides terrestris NRRL 8126]
MYRQQQPKVANSIPQWADKVRCLLNISDGDPRKNERVWQFGAADRKFPSASDLSEEDYLRLRVIWYHWSNINEFRHYMRDNPVLQEDDETSTRYTGYVSRENDELATKIYDKLSPLFRGYLDDIRSNKDGTRPGSKCERYFLTRYWQGLVMTRLKGDDKQGEAGISRKPRQDVTPVEDITAAVSRTTIASAPETPRKQLIPKVLEVETPAVPKYLPAIGGMQNPATSDETYVNTALLLLLQTLTLSMSELGNSMDGRLDLGDLEWLADRLPLKLYRHQPQSDWNTQKPAELMEARVDGYLCKRDYHPPDKDGVALPRYNNLPLAIVEAKPCVRNAAGSSIRWQESAEMACWVSSLDDDFEHYGLLQSSTSGRKRRLMVSQNRHEIYLIIAEYGQPWKDYIRTGRSSSQPMPRSKEDAVDLAGSDAFVKTAAAAFPDEFETMISDAAEFIKTPGGGVRQTRARPLELLGPEDFCIMQQWGPFLVNDRHCMDLFLRRLIALQVQLLSTATAMPAPQFDSEEAPQFDSEESEEETSD